VQLLGTHPHLVVHPPNGGRSRRAAALLMGLGAQPPAIPRHLVDTPPGSVEGKRAQGAAPGRAWGGKFGELPGTTYLFSLKGGLKMHQTYN